MAKNVSSSQGLFDDLAFAQSPLSNRNAERERRKGKSETVHCMEHRALEDWKNKMTVKKSVYLTKRNAEALALRHAGMAKTDRAFSKTVNAALEFYLAAEIQALEDADKDCLQDELSRYSRALSAIMSKRLEDKS